MNRSFFSFSILTPTWNREKYLHRVFDGLRKQTYSNFQWIVADDGSTDQTEKLIRIFAMEANFPITFIRADKHIGKIRMDNEAVRQAEGEFILWCDSDDWLLPNALQRLWEAWNTIPENCRNKYVGLTALAATDQGTIANPFPEVPYKDVSWNDLAEIHHVTTDMLFCARAAALKANPFPEVDLVIPESVVWTAIGDRSTRLISEVLLMKEYRTAYSISFSGTMSYNRGRAYALAETVYNLRSYHRVWILRVWRLITFIRYSLHGEIELAQARRMWGANSFGWAFWLACPLACGLAFKDRMQGKVRRTHREFIAAKVDTRYTVEILNERIKK